MPVANFLAGDIHGGGIDLEISSPTENFVPSEAAFNMKPGDSVNREIQLFNICNNPFIYSFEVEKISGDDDFCKTLTLSVRYKLETCTSPTSTENVSSTEPSTSPPECEETWFENACSNLMECHLDIGDNILYPNERKDLFFTLTLPNNVPSSLQNKTCQFEFIFTAQQIISTPPEQPQATLFNFLMGMLSNVSLAYFTDVEIITNTVQSGQWIKPDFWIDKIRPVQVVWEPDINGDGKIDLVAGKSTMVRVEVRVKDYEALDKNIPVEIRLIVPQPLDDFIFPRVFSFYKTIEELEQNNKIDVYLDFDLPLGDHTITAEVNPENKIKEADETNNKNSTKITVKDTRGLYLVYFPIDRPITYFGYGPIDLTEYSETVIQSGKFIGATYPVSEGEFTNQKSNWKYYGSPVPLLGMIEDAISIWLRGELLTGTLADRSVGIVPDNYFDYHLRDIDGKFFPYISAVLVANGSWTATAHEIGHTYGLHWPKEPPYFGPGEEYKTNPPWGNPASGFWVSEGIEIYPLNKETQKGGICFMGPSGAKNSFYYDALKWMPIWIDNEDYKALFKEFRVDKTDPNVLLINGLIFDDGTIQFGKMYTIEGGIVDNIIPGDYSIQILDKNNQVLTNIPFGATFETYTDVGGVEKGVSGFAFVIPYPENTSKIQIQHNEEILVGLNPNTKLLHDTVDSIPEYGFVNNADQRKNALHNKIDAVEKMLEENNFQGAVYKLEHDIKDKVEKWLVDDYQKESVEQFSKNEIIRLLDEIVQRLKLI